MGHTDLTGKRFGLLVAIERIGTKSGHALWKCQCDCGNTIEVRADALFNGKSSCGCSKNNKEIEDLTGKKFGKLTVLKLSHIRNNIDYWVCKCDCGNERIVNGYSLECSSTTSCGCSKKTHIDLTGQKFTKLTALKMVETKNHTDYWQCKCDCGNEKIVSEYNLKCGAVKSCGCLKHTFKDLTEQRFGRLIALERVEGDKKGATLWKCQCDCGNIVTVRLSNLQSGYTKSCGCLRSGPRLNKDITGRRFGKLIVLEQVSDNGDTKLWKCKCDCGNIVNITYHDLISGYKTTCGCRTGGKQCLSDKSDTKQRKERTYDITGQRFGKLTALEKVGKDNNGKSIWRCQCDCGNTKDIVLTSLTKGVTKSCGCLRNWGIIKEGQRFGKLTALYTIGSDNSSNSIWHCQCDCGNTTDVPLKRLKSEMTRSCGCLRKTKDLTGQRFGRLVALEVSPNDTGENTLWKCKCDCGNIIEVSYSKLAGSMKVTCGCRTGKKKSEDT